MSKYKAKEDKKQCVICGGKYVPNHATQKYCGNVCRKEQDRLRTRARRNKMTVEQREKEKEARRERDRKRHARNKPLKECLVCSGSFKTNENGAGYKYCSTDCSNVARRKRNREKFRKENGLYDKYGKERKCKYCSKDISDRPLDAMYCDDRCADMFRYYETTTSMPVNEYRKMIAEQAEEAKRKRLANKTITMYRPECLECGERFKTLNKNQRICSDKCRRSRSNRRKNTRIPEAQIVDRDIALPKLYIRDKGICYLCNEKCDYSDIKTTKDGYKYAGDTYPSIDHVMPVVHGGLHAWDNIRLAHRHCNSIKSDTIPDDLKELLPDDAYAVARKIRPRMKTTLQFNTKGKLVGTYESTAQAERETGVKRKNIQNCARGETKTSGGYVWKYA